MSPLSQLFLGERRKGSAPSISRPCIGGVASAAASDAALCDSRLLNGPLLEAGGGRMAVWFCSQWQAACGGTTLAPANLLVYQCACAGVCLYMCVWLFQGACVFVGVLLFVDCLLAFIHVC